MKNVIIDRELLSGCWNFIKQQARNIDTWFSFGLLALLASIGSLLAVAGVLGLLSVAGIAVLSFSIMTLKLASILIFVLLGTVIIATMIGWSWGFFNLWAANALDVAQHQLPMRRFTHRASGIKYFGALLLYCLLVMVGFLFLVIPGIVFLVRFSFVFYIMIDQGCTPWHGLQQSWQLTRGSFWTLLLYSGLCAALRSIPFVIIIEFFFPFEALSMAYLYEQLKARQLTLEQI